MSEDVPSPEVRLITREQVIEALRPIVDEGITHPDNIPYYLPWVRSAQRLLDDWINQEVQIVDATGAKEADLACNFEIETIYIDAGFVDPEYLRSVDKRLLIYLQEAQQLDLKTLAQKIQAKKEAIKNKNRFN